MKQVPIMDVPKSKVELHVHLDGSPRIATIIDLAKKKEMYLPAYDVKSLEDYVSLKEPKSLTCFLHCFSVFMPIIKGDADAIERISYEFCEDLANSGVLYCEARYCPHLLANCGVDDIPCSEKHNVSPEKVVETVNRGLEKGCQDFEIKVCTILTCMRHRPEWSSEIVDLCDKFRNKNVVGIDLAGDESLGEIPAIKDHIVAFQRAAILGISRTVHAGEAGPAASVHEAIFLLHANRIGHGYHVLGDEDLYKYVIEKQIHLELCPISSILTGAVTEPFNKHPAIKFAEDGVNFSLNTDDTLVCQNDMRKEFCVAFNKMGFTAAMLAKATFNAARSCFLPKDEKEDLINKLKVIHGVPCSSKDLVR